MLGGSRERKDEGIFTVEEFKNNFKRGDVFYTFEIGVGGMRVRVKEVKFGDIVDVVISGKKFLVFHPDEGVETRAYEHEANSYAKNGIFRTREGAEKLVGKAVIYQESSE